MAESRGCLEKRAVGAEVGVKRVCPSCNVVYPVEALVCPEDGAGLLEIPDAPLLTGTRLDDRYDVGGVVGTGGMGVVYRAHQRGMERDVAIKVLHPHYAHDPRAVKRFFREAQAASRLVHPNVVSVYDFGRSSQQHIFLVMELLAGWTLGDLIHHRAPLTPATAVEIASQIAAALEAAHGRRVVHRDLKPDNVQLVTIDGFVVAKVLDFGIARVMRDPENALGVHLSTVDIAGTPAYMSPEQIMGKDPDPRSDLYSLGVILYEMLTGVRPFVDDNSVTLCMKQLNEDPPALTEHVDEGRVPKDLQSIVYQLLEKDVDRRPGSAGMVRSQLLATGVSHDHYLAQVADGGLHPTGISTLPTRADLGPMMRVRTELGGAALDAASRSRVDDEETGCVACGASSPALDGACPRCGEPIPAGLHSAPPSPGRSSRGEPLVAAALLVPDEGDLREESVASWLRRREAEGWEVSVRHAVAILRVPRSLGMTTDEALRLVVDRARSLSLTSDVPIRFGALEVGKGAGPEYEDLVRRLAAVGGHGDICMPTRQATRVGLAGRSVASVFDAGGAGVPCIAVDEGGETRGSVLVGRNRDLRRLERAAEMTRRQGAVNVHLVGELGSGRTRLLQHFASTRPSLYLRVAPWSEAWPAHTTARVALACLGLPDHAPSDAIRARLQPLPTHLRERLAALLLDEPGTEGIGDTGLVYGLLELLEWRAGSGPFVLCIDDADYLDPGSQSLLQDLVVVAGERPWLIVTSSRRGAEAERSAILVDGAQRVELRPLGVRAAGDLLKALGVPPERQRALLTVGQGEPLALELLANWPQGTELPRVGGVVRAALPGHLRGRTAEMAERAWLTAVMGGPEAPGDLSVRAAALYLDIGLSESLKRWLAGRLRDRTGVGRRLVSPIRPGVGRAFERAMRYARLGLWKLAATEASGALAEGKRSDPELQVQIALWLARSGELDRSARELERALETSGSPVSGAALVDVATVLLNGGALKEAERVLGTVLTHAGDNRHMDAVGAAHALLARCAVRRSASARAMEHLELARGALQVVSRRDARRGRVLEAFIQEIRAELALVEGDVETTRTNLRQARDSFRDLGRPADAIRCLNDLGRLEVDEGDVKRAVSTFRAAVGLASTAGLHLEQRRARVGLGEALVQLGEVDQAATMVRRVLRESRLGRQDGGSLAAASTAMAKVMLARGLTRDAERYIELALSHGPDARGEARAHLVLADVLLASGEVRRASRALRAAEGCAATSGQGALRMRAAERLSVLRLPGTPDESVAFAQPDDRTSGAT